MNTGQFGYYHFPEGYIPYPSSGKHYSNSNYRGNHETFKGHFHSPFYFLYIVPGFCSGYKSTQSSWKKTSDVVKAFGNPVHQDNSNPSMKCMFYKGSTYTLTFVADENGVYQAEASASYDGEDKARIAIADFITSSTDFKVDSVSVSDFRLTKSGVKVDLQITENKLSKKFDVRVKAVRTGG